MTPVETLASTLFTDLTADADFSVPIANLGSGQFQAPATVGPLFELPAELKNSDVTEGATGGAGTFDVLMSGYRAQLEEEFKKNRITGAEYTKAFIALTQGAMGTATEFLLGRDTARWQAISAQSQAQLAQVQLVTARVQLETAKAQLEQLRLESQTARANYALTKMKLATEAAQYDAAIKQMELVDKQIALTGTQIDQGVKQLTVMDRAILLADKNILQATKQLDVMDGQITLTGKQAILTDKQATLADKQAQTADRQLGLISEQIETQRAQTLDTRSDGVAITGSVGMQKALYAQQITSYKRDAEVKAAKIFSDAWVTQKTMDEGLLAPNGFTNLSVDQVLSALKTNNNLG